MDKLFTSTTVLLTEEFVKSCSKESLQSKLSKLRLVTGVQFCKANKSYALTGKWEQVDAAFEILTHWQAYSEHEPDFENAWDGKLSKLCDCDVVHEFLEKLALNDQSESESSNDVTDIDTGLVDETIDLLENEYANLKDKIKLRKKGVSQKGSKSNSNNFDTDVTESVKRVILNRHKKEIGQNKISKSDSIPVKDKKTDVKNDTNIPKSTADEDESKVVFSPCIDNDTNENDYSENTELETQTEEGVNILEPVQINLESESHKSQPVKRTNKSLTDHLNEISEEKVSARKTKKPGDKGYWSRVKRTDGDLAHECPKCNVTLKSRKRYLEHLRRIHIKEYQCKVCEKRFGYPTDLKRHKCSGSDKSQETKQEAEIKENKEKPKGDIQFQCPECNYSSRIKKRLTSHIQRSHRKEYPCDQCNRMFGYQKDLDKHKENIHSGIEFFCDQCSKVYKNKQIFESHLKTHESGYIKPYYNCEHCSKSFTTKYSLAGHLQTVHLGMKKIYLCQICGKKFSQRSSYKQHWNAHNGVKPYKCNVCGKAFVYHKSLKEHKFMHDNIRRFQCTMCDKAFRQRTTLHIHMKIHKTVKDHVCNICGRGFSQKQAMERHERIHTGVRPYTCLLCKKSFGDTSTIRRHMVSLHQKTETNWREDTMSTLKKRSDYYVYGGSGQNRVYKSNPGRKIPAGSNKTAENHASSKSVKTDLPIPLSQTPLVQPESSLIVLNPIQNQLNEPKFDFVVNSATGSSVNGIAVSDSQNFQAFQNLQPGTIYAIATSQPQQIQEQNEGAALSSTAIPTNNGFGQIIDFSTMTFVATKAPQQSDRTENGQQLFQQPMQGQSMNMLQSATVVPLTPVTECLKAGQSGTSTQASSDSSLSQAIASIWGFVGYPSYQAQGNLTQYQPSQNQSN